MGITPTTPAVIYDFNSNPVSVKLMTLAAWVAILRPSKQHFRHPMAKTAEAAARKLLQTPVDYPVEDIFSHLETCLEETHAHYGINQPANCDSCQDDVTIDCHDCEQYQQNATENALMAAGLLEEPTDRPDPRMKTYKCDVDLEFADKKGEFLLGQLFSVTDPEQLHKEAFAYYTNAAGATKVKISSYILID